MWEWHQLDKLKSAQWAILTPLFEATLLKLKNDLHHDYPLSYLDIPSNIASSTLSDQTRATAAGQKKKIQKISML